jgi:thiol:disulfide interchange protein DsbG
MADLGFSGTPGLLFKDTSSQWRGQTGVPDQEALARLLGIAEYWMSFPIYSSLASS